MPTADRIITFDDAPPPPGADPWVVAPAADPIEILDHDPDWAAQATSLIARVQGLLGGRALRIDHVGSTAVPGLAAKPVVDLDLIVADPDREEAWLPPLVADGLVLTVREPWWQGHRMLMTPARDAQIHVFGPDSPEPYRHLIFRDHLRRDAADRELYAGVKREAAWAATSSGEMMMQYNARKAQVLREIYRRAFVAAGLLDAGDRPEEA